MKKRILSVIVIAVIAFGLPVFAHANGFTVSISDAAAFKSYSLTGNNLMFTATVPGADSALFSVSGEALGSFYNDSDIKYYTFMFNGLTVRGDKNNYYDFDVEKVDFTISSQRFLVTLRYKNGTEKVLWRTALPVKYTYVCNVSEHATAFFDGIAVNRVVSEAGSLAFTTDRLGLFEVRDYVFADVADSAKWYYGYVNKSAAYGILSGMGENMFMPASNVTRAQLAAMIVKATGGIISYRESNTPFSDVENGKWYYRYVVQCAGTGIMNGVGDGKFNPDAGATREEVAAVAARVVAAIGKYGDDTLPVLDNADGLDNLYADASEIHNYARIPVLLCNRLAIMIGDRQSFRPRSNITRAECAKIFSLIYFTACT